MLMILCALYVLTHFMQSSEVEIINHYSTLPLHIDINRCERGG